MYGGLRTKNVGYKRFNPISIPSRPTKYTPFYSLSGGINTTVPVHEIKDNELADAYNIEYTDWGLGTRAGKTKYNSTEMPGATGIRGIHPSYCTGSRKLLISDDTGKLYEDDGIGTFTEIYNLFTPDSKYFFNDWRNLTIIANENEKLFKWDGSNINEITGSPSGCAGVINAEGRLFAWKPTENNVYFCALNDEETWDAASEYSGFVIVPQIKGDYVVAVAKQGRTIIVFKHNSIWKYYLNGLPRNWTRELVSNAIGIAGKYAYTSFQDVIFFMGSDGETYQLAEGLKLISGNIMSPDTSRWGLSSDLNMSKKAETVCYYDPNSAKIRFIYNDVSATTNYHNMYADYYIVGNTWLRGNLSASCVAVCDGKGDTGDIYTGDPNSGYVYVIDSGTSDNETAIDAYILTKAYNFGIVDAKKILETAYISSKPVGNWNIQLRHYVDFDPTGTAYNASQAGSEALWDTAKWDIDLWGGSGLVRSRIPLNNATGYYHSFKFGCSILDKYFSLRGMGFKYKMCKLI